MKSVNGGFWWTRTRSVPAGSGAVPVDGSALAPPAAVGAGAVDADGLGVLDPQAAARMATIESVAI
jgi:hypothetical protein